MENKQNDLYIPTNVKTKTEFFKGYGVKELVITIIVMASFLPIAFILNTLKGTVIAVIFMFVLVAGTVIVVTRDDNNLSVAKQLKFMINSANSQKCFRYEYYNKWGRKNVK